MADGDWICCDPHCANINFARRNKCNRCHKDRTDGIGKKKLGQEIGKALADKSRGLFSADDWQCNKCGNVNWARRQQCNMCNAPKFGEIEERTGYGGGYNDRGVVEYIERDESDSEYDEFGRRKKKRHAKSSSDGNDDSSPQAKKKRPDGEEQTAAEANESSDEEDDGDDDLDLSKYDLIGWGVESGDDTSNGGVDVEEDFTNRENSKLSTRTNSRTSTSVSRSSIKSPQWKKKK